MARYALAYAPKVAQALVLLPPAAEKLGRQCMLELAAGRAHFEAGPAIERIPREIFGWRFVFVVDHRHQRVTLDDVRWTATSMKPAGRGLALLH